MKRSGVVLVIIGLTVGLLLRGYYVLNNFLDIRFPDDWYKGVYRTISLLDLVSYALVLIGFIVIASGLTKRAPTYPAPPAYPPPHQAGADLRK